MRPRSDLLFNKIINMRSSDIDIVDIVLADDDMDDCLLFKDALEELDVPTRLTTCSNGDELMTLLRNAELLPDVVFLDLNMPRKNGFECLTEIKQANKLRSLPVIIFSTSFEPKIVDMVCKNGAAHYICKPNEYSKLVTVVHYAVSTIIHSLRREEELDQSFMKDFVLLPEMCYNEPKR